MTIDLAPETRQRLLRSIQRYFKEQLEEEVGELKSSLLLDYVLREIGPTIYNQAIADAQAYLNERVADLDGVLYGPEFGYWKR